jgi:CRP/FNR family transcriptional regulator
MVQPTQICGDCAVRQLSLCGSVSDDELVVLNRLGRHQRLQPGQALVWAGGDSLHCGNIISGLVKVTASTVNGREQIVGLLYPGDFVGRPFAEETEFTIVALTQTELCLFPRRGFEQVLEDHPRMERLLLQRMMAALDQARARMLMLARKSAEERLAEFLLEIAHRMAPAGQRGASFELPLSRGQIAELLGLTIETVSRQMTRLKSAGIIALPGARSITILNPDELEARAEAA